MGGRYCCRQRPGSWPGSTLTLLRLLLLPGPHARLGRELGLGRGLSPLHPSSSRSQEQPLNWYPLVPPSALHRVLGPSGLDVAPAHVPPAQSPHTAHLRLLDESQAGQVHPWEG